MAISEVKCPRCAEMVKADAKVCKHCGHEFSAGELAANKKQSSTLKQGAIGCLAIIVLFVIGAAIFGGSSSSGNKTAEVANVAAEPPAPALKVTARELAAAYEANEVAAQKKYGGQRLEVTGVVTGVDLDLLDNPVLKLAGVNEFLPAQATFTKDYSDKLGELSKGQKVTITCERLSEVISAPMLNDCTI